MVRNAAATNIVPPILAGATKVSRGQKIREWLLSLYFVKKGRGVLVLTIGTVILGTSATP